MLVVLWAPVGAGKGRTGLMISALLLYTGICESPEEALRVFGERRTEDGHGVTISSQQRYVEYFHRVMREHGGEMPAPKGCGIARCHLTWP